jgi:hypothetical protein
VGFVKPTVKITTCLRCCQVKRFLTNITLKNS